MRKPKPLTFIAVVFGVLVLYCLMNHREGFDLLRPPKRTPEEQKAARDAASKNPTNVAGRGGRVVRNW